MSRLPLVMGALLLGCAAFGPAHAQFRWDDASPSLLGLRLSSGPVYFGRAERKLNLQPVLAARWGRFQLSSGGGSGLRGERTGSGASLDLLDDPDWRLQLGLRIDRGRSTDGMEGLSALPGVRSTVRGRMALTWRESTEREWTLAWSPDLLGHDGGSLLQFGVRERLPSWSQGPLGGNWTLQAQVTAGDKVYQSSYFGVPVGTPGLTAYSPGAGMRNANLYLGWQRPYGRHWMGFGGLSVDRLLGPAADAPFVQRATQWGLDAGVAYRF